MHCIHLQAAEALAAELVRQKAAGLSPVGDLEAGASGNATTIGDVAAKLANLQLAMNSSPGGAKVGGSHLFVLSC